MLSNNNDKKRLLAETVEGSIVSSSLKSVKVPTTFYLLNTPATFRGIALGVAAGALTAVLSILWLGGCKGSKEKRGILMFGEIVSGKLLFAPNIACLFPKKVKVFED